MLISVSNRLLRLRLGSSACGLSKMSVLDSNLSCISFMSTGTVPLVVLVR